VSERIRIWQFLIEGTEPERARGGKHSAETEPNRTPHREVISKKKRDGEEHYWNQLTRADSRFRKTGVKEKNTALPQQKDFGCSGWEGVVGMSSRLKQAMVTGKGDKDKGITRWDKQGKRKKAETLSGMPIAGTQKCSLESVEIRQK